MDWNSCDRTYIVVWSIENREGIRTGAEIFYSEFDAVDYIEEQKKLYLPEVFYISRKRLPEHYQQSSEFKDGAYQTLPGFEATIYASEESVVMIKQRASDRYYRGTEDP